MPEHSNKEDQMKHNSHTPYEKRQRRNAEEAREDWITARQLAEEYHIGRSTAYAAFKRLDTIRIGGCVRARRSEVEERLRRYGRI